MEPSAYAARRNAMIRRIPADSVYGAFRTEDGEDDFVTEDGEVLVLEGNET